jgi:hypothetical protein
MGVSSGAMASGAGRWARLERALGMLPVEDRDFVLETLDEISRPMTVRELDKAFQLFGLGCSDRKMMVAALKRFAIVLVRPA